jgi:hypothetical protein
MGRKVFQTVCFISYAISLIAALAILYQVINVRSKCTQEKARISKVLSKIQNLKDENAQLMIEYYRTVRPAKVDKGSRDLKLLHENEVEYFTK